MRIGLISDSHGYYNAIEQFAGLAGNIDIWLHAGDYCSDGNHLHKISGKPVIAVRGNCDPERLCKIDEFLEYAGKKIWLTHGHRYDVRNSIEELAWWGNQFAVDIIVYGHTHVPLIIECNNILIINPGSPAQPRKGSRPSCAILKLTADRPKACLITA